MKKWITLLLAVVLCVSMLAGCNAAPTPGGNGNTVPGEYYDAGNVNAFVPQGWKAFPVADVFAEDDASDPDAVTICKGGKDDFDLLTKPFVRIDFYGPDSMLMEPDSSWYSGVEELEPMKLGGHVWKGFTAIESDKKLAILWTEVENDVVQYQASVWLDASEGSVKLEDADVQAILANVKPSDPTLVGEEPDPETDTDPEPNTDPEPSDEPQADAAKWDYWDGEWYGWWCVTDAIGSFETVNDYAWDAYAVIDVDESNNTATLKLWDTETSRDSLLISCDLALNEGGKYGTVTSIEGDFFDGGRWIPAYDITPCRIEADDWKIDPEKTNVAHFDNMIEIKCDYFAENGTDTFVYYIYLRPWGTKWDDVKTGDISACIYTDMMPPHYDDWYAPLLEQGVTELPDSYADGEALLAAE